MLFQICRTLSQVIIFEGPIDAVKSFVDPGETAVVEAIKLTERLFFFFGIVGGGGGGKRRDCGLREQRMNWRQLNAFESGRHFMVLPSSAAVFEDEGDIFCLDDEDDEGGCFLEAG